MIHYSFFINLIITVFPIFINHMRYLINIRSHIEYVFHSAEHVLTFTSPQYIPVPTLQYRTTNAAPTLSESCTSTGVFCVTDCSGLDDGDYQACDTCRSYVSCSGGAAVLTRPCPRWGSSESSDDDDSSSEKYLVWDDDYKRCDWKSTTCTCKGFYLVNLYMI